MEASVQAGRSPLPAPTASCFSAQFRRACRPIPRSSKDRLEIRQGSLYPALYRLEHQGWITSEWGESENNHKAKYYRLPPAGKRRLQTQDDKWNRIADVIAVILHATPEEV